MTLPCVVHLDLKGAPWKVDFLCKIIPLLRANGAWGVLIEWEDMFPYTGDLVRIGSLGGCSREGLYTMDEVQLILKSIRLNHMEPISLVQSIGHMEFVLKHGQYRRLRELSQSPSVICPSRPGSQALVKQMVQQILAAQPDARYIHIGGDEAWYTDCCKDCKEKGKGLEERSQYLFHINSIATSIKELSPKITVIMWDDMLRPCSPTALKAYDIGNLVQPAIWNYKTVANFNIDIKLWEKYSFVFRNVWVASAYKGATSCVEMLCSIPTYTSNQVAWHNEVSVYEKEFHFAGIILTGWSRYDHYCAPCELLPVALPCLMSCLRMWTRPDGFRDGGAVVETLPTAEWPGHEVAKAVAKAAALRQRSTSFLVSDSVIGYLNSWQISHDFTNPMQVERMADFAHKLIDELVDSRKDLLKLLRAVTGPRSAIEYVLTYVAPAEKSMRHLLRVAQTRRRAHASVAPRSVKQQPFN